MQRNAYLKWMSAWMSDNKMSPLHRKCAPLKLLPFGGSQQLIDELYSHLRQWYVSWEVTQMTLQTWNVWQIVFRCPYETANLCCFVFLQSIALVLSYVNLPCNCFDVVSFTAASQQCLKNFPNSRLFWTVHPRHCIGAGEGITSVRRHFF